VSCQRSLVAEILQVDLDPFRQRVLVNKGTREGVFRGQAAIDANRHCRPGHACGTGLGGDHPDFRSRARDSGRGESDGRA
jgi:hypothetical protein